MKKLLIPISVGIVCTSFTLFPSLQSENSSTAVISSTTVIKDSMLNTSEEAATSLYTTMHLDAYGLSNEAFTYAWKGYQKLLDKNQISRSEYLTICDFSQPSSSKRLYIIDIANNKLVTNTYVAHGKNSGGEYATNFSNKPESLQSSLGFYITSNTYIGKHGLSLRVNGVDAGW